MLKIDPEFSGKIPPLTAEEYRQLEENILAEGAVLMPMIVWNGLIVDGHNRYKIIQEHPEIEYEVYEKDFPNRYAAIVWICKNQLGRRNLTPQQKKYLIGQRYEAEKMAHGASDGFRGNQYTEVGLVRGQNDLLPESRTENQNGNVTETQSVTNKTRKQIAAETHTSDSYVKRAGQYAQGVDAAEEALPGIRQEILSGAIHPTESAVTAVAKAPAEKRREKAEQLRYPWKSFRVPDGETAYAMEPEEGLETTPHVSPKLTKAQNLAAIRKIGEDMASPASAMTVEFVLFELKDAVDTLMDRWDVCMETYPDLISAAECRDGIRKLVASATEYLEKVKGGL